MAAFFAWSNDFIRDVFGVLGEDRLPWNSSLSVERDVHHHVTSPQPLLEHRNTLLSPEADLGEGTQGWWGRIGGDGDPLTRTPYRRRKEYT